MPVSVTTRPAEASAVGPEWEDLAAHASEPNVFLERWMLVAGLEHFPAPPALLVFAYSDRTGELIGLFPLQRRRGYRQIPVAHVTSWTHPHSPLSTPLLRRGHEDEAVALLFRWLDVSPDAGLMLELKEVGADGPVYASIRRAVDQGRRRVDVLTYERALLHSTATKDEYLRRALAGKRLKEYRRLQRRLSEQGHLAVESLAADDDVEKWLDDFLDLEHRGWKGEAGTALAVHQHEEAFFLDVGRAAFQRGRLLMLRMSLDGVPIAMKCSFSSGRAAFALKIAYDERWARFSPGLLLELRNIEVVLDGRAIDWMDSCAAHDHFMINRLWTERRTLCEMIVSQDRLSSRLVTSGIARLRGLRRGFRRSREIEQPDLHD